MRRLCPALGHCPEHIVQIGLADGQFLSVPVNYTVLPTVFVNYIGSALWDRLKTKKALIFIRTVSAVRKGLEPSTSGVTGRRSNQAELPHQ